MIVAAPLKPGVSSCKPCAGRQHPSVCAASDRTVRLRETCRNSRPKYFWFDGIPITSAQGDQQYQAIVADGSGGAIVSWAEHSTTSIRAQRVNGWGATLWPLAGALVCSSTGEHWIHYVQSDAAGGVLVGWSDYRVGGGDVYLQRIGAIGQPMWALNGVATCLANLVQGNITLASDGAGGALAAWVDFRSGTTWDLYAQNVNAAGVLGGATLAMPRPRGSLSGLRARIPNG